MSNVQDDSYRAAFAELESRYAMRVDKCEVSLKRAAIGHVYLKSPRCRVRIGSDLDGTLAVYILGRGANRCYDLPLVIGFRNPTYQASKFLYLVGWPYTRGKVRAAFSRIVKALIKNCDDLLQGNFNALEEEGFSEFKEYVGRNMSVVYALLDSDPVKKKYMREDYSWVGDLKARGYQ